MSNVALTITQIKVINDLTLYDTDVLYCAWPTQKATRICKIKELK